jgi:uncharacterized damage-inducible protein DinB
MQTVSITSPKSQKKPTFDPHANKSKTTMQSPRTHLIDQFRRTFDGEAWHGPAVMEVLRDIPAELASRRLGESHSVGELAGHILAWREYAIAKLEGDADYKVLEEENFPPVSAENWSEIMVRLEASQHELLGLLEGMSDERMQEIVPGKKHTFSVLLHGLVHHDVYHLGQLVLMKMYLPQ